MKNTNSKKMITLFLMILSLGIIYFFPYLSYYYYTPLMEAFGLESNEAFGRLLNMYGIANVILYIPGGWIADKFDCKKLMVFSMVGTGVLALWESMFPSYAILTLIFILFAVTTVLTFWSASIKCINVLADADEQGSMFGSLETGRNILALILTTIWTAIFSATGSVRAIMVVCAILHIVAGVLLAFLMPPTKPETINKTIPDSIKALGGAFKQPQTYLLAGMIFCMSMTYASVSYFAPYLEAMGGAVKLTTAFSNYNKTICGIAGAALAAVLAKKTRSSSKVLIFAGIILLISCVLLWVFPQSSGVVVLIMLFMVIATLMIYMFRALYYATVDEGGVPKNEVGNVIGIASILGFLPDTFYASLCGRWLDTLGNAGYKNIFMCCIAASCLGIIASFISEKRIQKLRADGVITEY